MNSQAILVTGASGALGQLVCRDLVAARQQNIIAASRTPEKLAALAHAGIEPRRLDFDDPATLDAAFSGVGRALIISTDELARPGHRQRQHAAALEAAGRNGVRHVAYTSMPNPEASVAIPFAADHIAMEAALRSSGLAHSSLRNSWYQENLLAYLPQIVRDGVWFTAAGNGQIAYVARADAAAAAAKVLASDEGFGEVDVAGSEALTVEQIAVLLGEALSRPIRVEHVGRDRLERELARQGVSPAVIHMVAVTEANQAAGHFDVSPYAMTALTERQPKTISDFFRAHADGLLALTRGDFVDASRRHN